MMTSLLFSIFLSPVHAEPERSRCSKFFTSVGQIVMGLERYRPDRRRILLRGTIGEKSLVRLESLVGKEMRVLVSNHRELIREPHWSDGLRQLMTGLPGQSFRGRLVEVVPPENDSGSRLLRFETAKAESVLVVPFSAISSGGFFGKGFERLFSRIELIYRD